MTRLTDYPLLLSLVSVLVLWGAALAGGVLRRRHQLERDVREDFGVILAATLTLLGLIIGFSFSMAVGRYDQRKNYEEAEANAIGTEYVRADLLPAAAAANVRALLSRYLDQRILFYMARPLDGGPGPGQRAADLRRPRLSRGGHERRAELPGIHAGGLVEPYPPGGLGLDGGDRHLLQPTGRLWGARPEGEPPPPPDSPGAGGGRVLAHRGH